MDLNWLDVPAVQYGFHLWVFALGAAVGSFLNVVVYRVPRGQSLVYPPSHCPRCGHWIRWYDNVPVVSWVILAGKCRDCRGPIAIRYPLVEALCAAMFVAVVGWIGLGGHLPQRPELVGQAAVLRSLTRAEAIGASAFHLVLLGTLLAMGLIEYDGHRLPGRVALPALVIGGIVPLVWPQVRPVPAVPPMPAMMGLAEAGRAISSRVWLGAVDGLVGVGVGGTIGLAAWRLWGHGTRAGWVFGPTCLGLFLGWQAAAVISAGVIVLRAGLRCARRGATRHAAWVDRLFPNLVFWGGGLCWTVLWERLSRLVVLVG